MKRLELPGIIYDESNTDYHANNSVSRSGLKDFTKRPSLFKKKHLDKLIVQEETPAMMLGTAAHTLVLEPDEFPKNYVVLDADFNGRTKDGKEFMADIKADGLIPLKHDIHNDLVEIRKSVFANPVAAALLSQGLPEITWRLEGEFYSAQCRTDWFCPYAQPFNIVDDLLPSEGEPYDVDFKTTQSLDDWVSDGWNNTIFKFGYDEQCVFYRAVQNRILERGNHPQVEKFYFIVTEKQEPRETAVFLIDLSTLNDAFSRVMDDMNRLNECFRTDVWPSFIQQIVETGVAQRVRESGHAEGVNSRRMLTDA